MPKKYVEQVGEDGFKKAPIGAGPYKFVSFTPGVELVCEAFEGYWRKAPAVKRLVFKVIPDEATRLAALQRGEVDIAYSIRGELAEELQRTPGLTIKAAVGSAPFWLYFADQWDAEVALARSARAAGREPGASTARRINEALTLGHSHLTGSVIPGEFRLLLAAAGAGIRSGAARSCWPRPGFPTASMPAITTATPPTPISARWC